MSDSDLPAEIETLVTETVGRTRLWRGEKADVADELRAHFTDGLASGRAAGALIEQFGDAATAARLIGRAKRRKRPIVWRAGVRSLQGVGALLAIVLALYAFAAIRLSTGTPVIARDFVADLTQRAREVPEDDRAWPLYRKALMAFGEIPDDVDPAVRPGDEGWAAAIAWASMHVDAFDLARQAAVRPGLGYLVGYTVDEADRDLWPEQAAGWGDEPPEAGIIALVLPVLGEMRKLSQLFALDARRAAVAGDGETAVANLIAGVRVAIHARETSLLLCDLTSNAQLGLALASVGEVLSAYPDVLTDDHLAGLARELAALSHDDMVVRIDGERMWFEDFVQRIYTDDGNGDGRLTATGVRRADIVAGFVGGAGSLVLPSPVAVFLMADRRDLTEWYDTHHRAIEAEIARPLWLQDPETLRRIEQLVSSATYRWRYFPAAFMLEPLTHLGPWGELATQRRDAMLVAIALERYRRRNGVWPDTPAQLLPDLLAAVPIDRFDGAPLRYAVVDGRPLVYSIGADLDDDGGRPAGDETGAPQPALASVPADPAPDGDWVLWPASP